MLILDYQLLELTVEGRGKRRGKEGGKEGEIARGRKR
jgi:hypothetical protein